MASQSRRGAVPSATGRVDPAKECEALDGDDGHRVGDAAVKGHRQDVVERQPADDELLGAIGGRLAVAEAGRDEQDRQLVADAVREMERASSRQSVASTPVSSSSSRSGTIEAALTVGNPALGEFPRIGVERVAVLADEEDAMSSSMTSTPDARLAKWTTP